jgi:uroporphyrin-III C-methyltransferase / precorrin-2 dehydrogenase / sirohydrochlorin ferrochelatase
MIALSRPRSDKTEEIMPARITALSVLPVFLNLKGRRVLVGGASDAAAWKAELLAATGAIVDVRTGPEAPSATMLAVAEREEAVTLTPTPWSPVTLEGAAIALADIDDLDEAKAFRCAAKAAGVPCNVIDKPAFCDFQFGSIVNRSPIVVGISTSGAAPVLGQAVRRRIETLLAPSLAAWGQLAARLRKSVNETLSPGPERRRFWEDFVDRAFGAAPGEDAETELFGALGLPSIKERETGHGHVTFVGAGPGDAELLTLKAVRALQSADVILFDDLVADEVLELARREAKRILVGKRAGRPSCKQDEINGTMVSLAKAGRRVVRLKSGDPMIFGRAGEEIATLNKAGISYDVVPGITAGLALAAQFGVSLTHRDYAKSIRFVTGHSKRGGLPADLDWAAVADRSASTIFYMSARTAGAIGSRLLAQGMAADTPVVFAANVGRADSWIYRTSIETLSEKAIPYEGDGPVIVGIGLAFGECPSAAETAFRIDCKHRAGAPATSDATPCPPIT